MPDALTDQLRRYAEAAAETVPATEPDVIRGASLRNSSRPVLAGRRPLAHEQPTATTDRGSLRRQRRTLVPRAAVALVMVALVAIAIGVGSDTDSTTVSGHAANSWRHIATPNLSARDQGVAVWTGEEVVVVGGSSTKPCAPNGDCLINLEPLADGAAYDPGTDAWRPIANAPVPFVRGYGAWTGNEVLVLAEGTGGPDVLLAYDPAADAWARRPDPPANGIGAMTWTGDSWVGISEFGGSDDPGWRYRPTTGAWEALPPDPIGRLGPRVLVWTGTDLVLLGSRAVEGGPTPNGLWEAAALSSDGVWRRLPSSSIDNNGGTWTAINGLVVNPGTEYSGEYDTGGILDLDRERWLPLPVDQSTVSGDRTGYHGVAGRWVADDDRLLDPVESEWHTIKGRPDDVLPAVAVWTGTEIVTWGGTIGRSSDRPDLADTGLAYTPPA